MRVAAASILAVTALAVAASFVIAPRTALWLPAGVTTIGDDVDGLFRAILVLLAIAFVGTHAVLVASVWRFARASTGKARFTHGNARVELAWTVIPAAILATLAFVQLSTWQRIKARPKGEPPLARVDAFQFGWRFVHAGPDRALDTGDDVAESYELVVPRGEVVWLELVSRDVIHSFFVPSFRLKQDVVPGMTIPMWFEAREEGLYDLVCAELCGFGHYKMAGRVRVVSRPAYDAWLAAKARAFESNGEDER